MLKLKMPILKKSIVALLLLVLLMPVVDVVASDDVPMPRAAARTTPVQSCKSNDEWSEPTVARHIYGNAWYVGTCAISVILIATPKGHFLIDGATEKAVPAIESNITSLGVDLRDIKYILVSHEHIDHVGGVSKLQRDTGAQVIARNSALDALRNGKNERSDPQFLNLTPFTPISNVQVIADGGSLAIAETKVNNIPMSGHAPGGSGWTWRECESNVCVNMVFSDSVGSISDKIYRFSELGSISGQLLASTIRLENTACDILLTGHVKQSNLLHRLDGKAPLIDTSACKAMAKSGQEALKKRLEDEKTGSSN